MATANMGWIVLPGSARPPVLLPEKRVGSPSMVVHQGHLMGESAALVSGTLPPKSVLPASTASLSACRSIQTIIHRVSKKGHFIKMYVATL